jgi:hypothetical protein
MLRLVPAVARRFRANPGPLGAVAWSRTTDGLLKQLNQFGRHMSQALKISEKFRQSQVT